MNLRLKNDFLNYASHEIDPMEVLGISEVLICIRENITEAKSLNLMMVCKLWNKIFYKEPKMTASIGTEYWDENDISRALIRGYRMSLNLERLPKTCLLASFAELNFVKMARITMKRMSESSGWISCTINGLAEKELVIFYLKFFKSMGKQTPLFLKQDALNFGIDIETVQLHPHEIPLHGIMGKELT